ncbi:MAG: hypothetical protein KAH91_04075, partial [Thermoplasmatales archaeon]|nr:hypothetical protein [Thermoplasmatales archaeon]
REEMKMREKGEIDLINKAIKQFHQDCNEKGYRFLAADPHFSSKQGDVLILGYAGGEIAKYRIHSDISFELISHTTGKEKR